MRLLRSLSRICARSASLSSGKGFAFSAGTCFVAIALAEFDGLMRSSRVCACVVRCAWGANKGVSFRWLEPLRSDKRYAGEVSDPLGGGLLSPPFSVAIPLPAPALSAASS